MESTPTLWRKRSSVILALTLAPALEASMTTNAQTNKRTNACTADATLLLLAGVSWQAKVTTGCLPGGSSSMAERAMSPWAVRARVRGMGVAVMDKTWGRGVFLFCSLALWFTPNLQQLKKPSQCRSFMPHWHAGDRMQGMSGSPVGKAGSCDHAGQKRMHCWVLIAKGTLEVCECLIDAVQEALRIWCVLIIFCLA